MWKFLSRKFLALLVYGGIVYLNRKQNLGMSEIDIGTLATTTTAYILGESYIDSKGHKKE